MTDDFAPWLNELTEKWSDEERGEWVNSFVCDLAALCAQLHEALEHWCWHANTGAGGYDVAGEHPGRNCMEAEAHPDPDDAGCPGRCKPCAAIDTAREFQEKHDE